MMMDGIELTTAIISSDNIGSVGALAAWDPAIISSIENESSLYKKLGKSSSWSLELFPLRKGSTESHPCHVGSLALSAIHVRQGQLQNREKNC
jgi:hypothetical protein